jgi:hypothetical protein
MQQTGSRTKTGVLLLWMMVAGYASRGQDIVLHGWVRDSATGVSISNASIAVKGLHGGARTNAEGKFRIPTGQHAVDIVISSVGYNTLTLHLDSVPRREVVIGLTPQFRELRNVTVVNKKQKYRNKDNPAVELIRKVIENKSKNRMEAFTYASYEKYEKLQASVDKATDTKAAKTKLLKPYHFLVENGDTSKMEGRTLSPVYLEETLSDVYYRKDPEKTKTIVLGKKRSISGSLSICRVSLVS